MQSRVALVAIPICIQMEISPILLKIAHNYGQEGRSHETVKTPGLPLLGL
jgi:hypothetical protein